MADPEKFRLGDMLLQQKLITQEQLKLALEQQVHSKLKLGRILVDNDFVTEMNISETLAKQLNIPFIDLKKFQIKPELVRLLPESLARQFHAIVLEDRDGMLLVGMADPTDLNAADEISRIVKSGIDVAAVTEGQLLQNLDRSYLRSSGINGSGKEISN
jgi:MSHA biogenesis protein MshE